MVMVDSSSERQISLFAEDPKAIAWQRKLLRVEQLARAGELVAGTPEYEEFVVRDGAPKLRPPSRAARRLSGPHRASIVPPGLNTPTSRRRPWTRCMRRERRWATCR